MDAPGSGAGEAGRGPPGASFPALEQQWLQALRGISGSDAEAAGATLRCLMRALERGSPKDLLQLQGYSLISVSDLQSQQRMPCCSHLTWSSDEFREWVRQGEGVLSNQRRLQRTHLILVGYLTDERLGEKEKLVDGSLYMRDNTGELSCTLLRFELEWLGCLLLFPSWIYIPKAGKSTPGYLEIMQDPIQVMPSPEKTLDILPVFYPRQAAQLLNARPQYKEIAKLNVAGELCRLSTLFYIHQNTFFFIFLKCFSSATCIPVFVQRSSQLVWHHVLQLGHRYVLTALKTACLKASGLRVFITSSSSHLLPYCTERVKEQSLDSTSEGSPTVSVSTKACEQLSSSLELEEEAKTVVPLRKSQIISYAGTITQVLNAQAGLYELDNKFTLCLAYQQMLNYGRGLRPGAGVELQDVHLVQKPLAASPSVLGACLRSVVVLKSFSPCSTFYQPVALFGNFYIQLLLRFNLSLPLYIWLVSLLETFEQRFCILPHQQSLHCLSHQAQAAAEKFIVPILNVLVPLGKEERNIHQEILAEEHHCPLQQFEIFEPPCQIPPFSLLSAMAEKKGWESLSPLQQLNSVPELCNVIAEELNRRLAWSYSSLSAESFQPRMVLLGWLDSSSSGSLKLQDRSKALPCIIFHRDGRPFAETSLVGCLLQVEIFQFVIEQFLRSDFPSWQQLGSPEHIKEKKTRPCIQFCFEDVEILYTPEKRASEGRRANERTSSQAEGDGSSAAEPRSQEGRIPSAGRAESGASTAEPSQGSAAEAGCVSRLFLVTQKEGLVWRNYLPTSGHGGKGGRAAQLCFQATVVWMGSPELCKNPGETGCRQEFTTSALQETSETQQKLLLLFLRKSLRWFPFLHPDHLYQLTIPQCTDLGVFDQLCCSPAQGNLNPLRRSLFLPVPDGALLHHVGCVSQLVSTVPQMDRKLFSIAEILSSSFTGSLVSFPGLIVQRTLVQSYVGKKSPGEVLMQQMGNLLTRDYTVKLRVSPTAGAPEVLDVYIEAAFLPYLWGLLPGARILFQNLQRKVSIRFKNVYCTYIMSSCVSVLAAAPHDLSSLQLGAASAPSVLYLSKITPEPSGLGQAQVACHVTCVLSLSLHWSCSLCNSIFTEGRCSQYNPPCLSRTGVCKARARIIVEDGTNEFVVVCKNQQVQKVLALSAKEWDVLQNHVKNTGSIGIQHSEVNTAPEQTEEREDLFTWYLRSLCRSPVVCRPVLLTFRPDRKPSGDHEAGLGQLRRFFSNGLEFLSQTRQRWNLMCLDLQEVT
nr:CST complex subunit CTC1 isoform X1 [Podarcis muralis]